MKAMSIKTKRAPRRRNRRRNGPGTLSRFVSAPVAYGTVSRGVATNVKHVESACEFLMSLVIPTTGATGEVVASMLLTPALMAYSRLRALSGLYAQHRFRNLRVELIPACPSTSDGSLVVALDRNVTFNPNSGAGATTAAGNLGLAYAMGCEASMMGPIWQPFNVSARNAARDSRQKYYLTDVTGAVEESAEYRLLVVQAVPTTTPTGGVTLMVRISYIMEFDSPVSVGSSTSISSVVVAPAGATVSVSTGSQLTCPGLPSTGANLNGVVYAVTPQLTGGPGSGSGLQPGSEYVGAVVANTKSDGTAAIYYSFPSVEAALSNSYVNGTIFGTGTSWTTASDTSFLPMGRVPLAFHM
jgi:hypothetical protein